MLLLSSSEETRTRPADGSVTIQMVFQDSKKQLRIKRNPRPVHVK